MNNVDALIYANVAIWLGFGFYLFYLLKKQNEIQKKVKSLDLEMENED